MTESFLEGYGGQTTEELLALADRYRIDSIVLAFEEAIGRKAPERVSTHESCVLAVEALEREVNNGGYGQFFTNSSREFVGIVEQALREIDCPETARITADAIAALDLQGGITPEKAEAAVLAEDPAVEAALHSCDRRYFQNDEPIADRLFAWIKANRGAIRLGDA
jgi:hypothetical protein